MTPRDTVLTRYARIEDCLDRGEHRMQLRGDEARHYERISDLARRRQWLAARVLSRALLCEALSLDKDHDLQIVSRDERGRGTRPIVLLAGRRLDVHLSVSHSARGVLVALGLNAARPLGVDLCDSLTVKFETLRPWFSPREHIWIQAAGSRAALAWAVKEAVYKAASQGAAWNPRELEVWPAQAASFQCRYRGRAVTPLTLLFRAVDGQTAVIACLALASDICPALPGWSQRAAELDPPARDPSPCAAPTRHLLVPLPPFLVSGSRHD